MKLAPFLLAAALLLASCQRPHAIALPSTTAVRVPIQAAQTHVAHAVALGKRESAILGKNVKGLSAAQVQQVAALVATDQREKLGAQDQLTAALYQTGTLQQELDAQQLQIDALAKSEAAMAALAKSEALAIKQVDRSRWFWRGLFALSLVLDYMCGAFVEARLRGAVTVLHGTLATGYHAVAGFLKGVFPLYLCWLPA